MQIKLLELDPKRRDAVLNSALKEFALKGFDDASTNIIAKEAGISKALMFHYVNSKKDLFLFTCDYFADLMDKEYFALLNLSEKDIFNRLHQSYLLQIELIKRYPWIFEFNKLFAATHSDEINKELEARTHKKQMSCFHHLFDDMDESSFREGFEIEKAKQILLWANIGFTNQILDDIRNSNAWEPDYESILAKLNGYIEELRKIFYKR